MRPGGVSSTPMAAPRSRAPAKLYSSIRIDNGREPALYSSTGVLMSYTADRNVINPTVTAAGASSGTTMRQYMRSHAAPHVRAASSTSAPIWRSDVLNSEVLSGAARTTNATARPTTLPYNTVRNGVARNSHSNANDRSTPGTAHGAHTSPSTMRKADER